MTSASDNGANADVLTFLNFGTIGVLWGELANFTEVEIAHPRRMV